MYFAQKASHLNTLHSIEVFKFFTEYYILALFRNHNSFPWSLPRRTDLFFPFPGHLFIFKIPSELQDSMNSAETEQIPKDNDAMDIIS